MKSQIITLNILSAIAATCFVIQPAQAADAGGARFKFAPTYWKQEAAQAPAVEHNVQSGSVPVSSKFLGLDPKMLAKPQVVTTVAAKPVFTQVTPQMLPSNFNSAFGKPAEPPQVASAPAQAKAVKLPQHGAHAIAHRGIHASEQVAAKLVKHAQDPSMVANAGNRVESYGKNFGYVPGTYVPTSTGDGMSTQTDVHGKLLRD